MRSKVLQRQKNDQQFASTEEKYAFFVVATFCTVNTRVWMWRRRPILAYAMIDANHSQFGMMLKDEQALWFVVRTRPCINCINWHFLHWSNPVIYCDRLIRLYDLFVRIRLFEDYLFPVQLEKKSIHSLKKNSLLRDTIYLLSEDVTREYAEPKRISLISKALRIFI